MAGFDEPGCFCSANMVSTFLRTIDALVEDRIRRREFITLLAGSLAWPRVARAQPAVPVIGFVNGGFAKGYAPFVEAFRQGLKQAGYTEGKDVVIQYRWGEGDATKAAGFIAELIGLSANVIVISGGDAAAADAKAATSTIPVVATFGSDPVDAGIVANINRPGGGIYTLHHTIQDVDSARQGGARFYGRKDPHLRNAGREGAWGRFPRGALQGCYFW